MSQLIKANTIIGLEVITVDNGKKVSTAKEVIYDVLTNQVMGIVVDEKGWFQNAKIVLIDNIHSIGDDAILIPSESAIIEANNNHSSIASSIANDQNFLTKNEVITESGKKLGRVTDIYFDFPSGRVDAIEISEGFLQNIASGSKMLKVSNIITDGENNLIVRDYAEDELSDQSQGQGLNKIISDTSENVTNLAQKTYEAVKTTGIDLAQKAGEKTQEIMDSETVQNAMHQIEQAAQNAKKTVTEKYNQAKGQGESEKLQEGIQGTLNNAKETMQNAVENSQDMARVKTDEIKTALSDQRITNSIGKRIGKIIIVDDQNNILASPGDIITHELVTLVKERADIEELLDNVV